MAVPLQEGLLANPFAREPQTLAILLARDQAIFCIEL